MYYLSTTLSHIKSITLDNELHLSLQHLHPYFFSFLLNILTSIISAYKYSSNSIWKNNSMTCKTFLRNIGHIFCYHTHLDVLSLCKIPKIPPKPLQCTTWKVSNNALSSLSLNIYIYIYIYIYIHTYILNIYIYMISSNRWYLFYPD